MTPRPRETKEKNSDTWYSRKENQRRKKIFFFFFERNESNTNEGKKGHTDVGQMS